MVGRARPSITDDPGDFAPGSGFTNTERGAFPSGHTSSAFALAAVLHSEFARRASPFRIPVAVLAYGSASVAGLARVEDNRHWATDVLAGAALGYLIGENVVEFAYRNADALSSDSPAADDSSTPIGAVQRLPLIYISIPLP